MTSLTEVYEGNAREVSSLRRLYAGTALVFLGAALAVAGVLVATTDLFVAFVGEGYGPIKWAGALAGLGVPAVLVGVFAVLPAGRRIRAAAAIGASVCLLGVVLFWHAYPTRWRSHWSGSGDDLTLLVSAVYLLGLFTAIWCLFVGVANFKTRNDPGGALELNVTRRGRTKVVEVENSSGLGGLGGVGFLGRTPDGEVETQTAGPSRPAARASDGGSSEREIRSPSGDATLAGDGPSTADPADRYCGNCGHFRYVRSSAGMTPYCGYREEAMDDMDACEEWEPNHR